MQARLVFTSCARCPLLLSEALTYTLQREKIHLTVCAASKSASRCSELSGFLIGRTSIIVIPKELCVAEAMFLCVTAEVGYFPKQLVYSSFRSL